MASCVFFGHSRLNVKPFSVAVEREVVRLIEQCSVTQFYNGFRGNFDRFCAALVWRLKAVYPDIKNTLALSYIPDKHFVLPSCFDDSVYLLERKVPPRFAIIETNKRMVEVSDFIICAVNAHFGGAYAACEYAQALKKPVVNVLAD